MKLLGGADWARFFFMTNQMTTAAINPRTARPPTTPPAIAPALEPPPPPPELLDVLFGGTTPVPVLVWLIPVDRVDTGGFVAVDSGEPAKMMVGKWRPLKKKNRLKTD